MKAIVAKQPYAALIVAAVKTIETRPSPPNGPMRPGGVRGLPGLAIEPGERIAVCAAKEAPGWVRLGPPGQTEGPGVWDVCQATGIRSPCEWGSVTLAPGDWYCYERPATPGRVDEVTPLPLGAVVGTVVVSEALPMVGELGGTDDPLPRLCVGADWLRVMRFGEYPSPDITSQLPLGEFAPGRWGWMLTDPQPCDPIPVVGKQGVFRLPEDVAALVLGDDASCEDWCLARCQGPCQGLPWGAGQ